MGVVGAGYLGDAFADKGVGDDELRFPVVALFRNIQSIEKLLHVLPIDFLNIESVSFETFAGVFALCFLCCGVERDRVGVVNQDQIIETEMACERARL